jgi:Ca2+:H+ antiporter
MRLTQRIWYLMLVVVPVAFLVHWLRAGPLLQFLVAALGIIPLAAVMGRATESLAARVGPRVGGILSASFGNAADLILGLVALNRGLIPVVKASITGSIIGNALLVLGLSLLVGGVRNRRQTFDHAAVGLQSTLLVVAAIGLTIPSVLARTIPARQEVNLSEEVAAVFLATYALNVLFTVFPRRRKEEDVVGGRKGPAETPPWGPWLAGGILLGATACVALLSEILVGAIETARDQGRLEAWGMSEVFVGVVVVAVIGNAAENSAAVVMAYRNKIDLSLHIAIGSSLQIALLVMPLLVFASLLIAPEPLDLHFTLLEILAVGASVLVVHLVAADGQTHWMEGVLLLAVYLILAMAFYHLPADRQPEPPKAAGLPPPAGSRPALRGRQVPGRLVRQGEADHVLDGVRAGVDLPHLVEVADRDAAALDAQPGHGPAVVIQEAQRRPLTAKSQAGPGLPLLVVEGQRRAVLADRQPGAGVAVLVAQGQLVGLQRPGLGRLRPDLAGRRPGQQDQRADQDDGTGDDPPQPAVLPGELLVLFLQPVDSGQDAFKVR